MQDANWNDIRAERDLIVEHMSGLLSAKVQPVYNGFEVTYPDGSQVFWAPTITRDAPQEEPS